MRPGQFVPSLIGSHRFSFTRTSWPLCPTTHNPPAASSATDWAASKGSPASRPTNSAVRGRIWFKPPPSVPAQIFPSRSSKRQLMVCCEVGTLWTRWPSQWKSPLSKVPIQIPPARSVSSTLGTDRSEKGATGTGTWPSCRANRLSPATAQILDFPPERIALTGDLKLMKWPHCPSRQTASFLPRAHQIAPSASEATTTSPGSTHVSGKLTVWTVPRRIRRNWPEE